MIRGYHTIYFEVAYVVTNVVMPIGQETYKRIPKTTLKEHIFNKYVNGLMG